MVPEKQRLSNDERINLVAYLDGELDEAASRSLAAKLTQSISARREVESLEATWMLLDYLPRPQVADDFAAKTATIATQAVGLDERLAAAGGLAIRGAARVAVVAATALACAGIGYAATRWAWPDPTRRLGRDLPIAEDLHGYRAVGTIEFLRDLDATGAFDADTD